MPVLDTCRSFYSGHVQYAHLHVLCFTCFTLWILYRISFPYLHVLCTHLLKISTIILFKQISPKSASLGGRGWLTLFMIGWINNNWLLIYYHSIECGGRGHTVHRKTQWKPINSTDFLAWLQYPSNPSICFFHLCVFLSYLYNMDKSHNRGKLKW